MDTAVAHESPRLATEPSTSVAPTPTNPRSVYRGLVASVPSEIRRFQVLTPMLSIDRTVSARHFWARHLVPHACVVCRCRQEFAGL
jgi:hypothetical protein